MEVYIRAIVAAVCVLAGLLVGTLGISSILNLDKRPSPTTVEVRDQTSISRHRISSATSNAIALRTLELTSARRRVATLQLRLDELMATLSDARRELQNLADQNERLRTERNETLDWLLMLLDQEAAPQINGATEGSSTQETSGERPLDAQQWQEWMDLEDLRSELELARAELAEANAARQIERAEAEAARENTEQLAALWMARMGADAVTVLSEALEHSDPEVRRFAAKALRAFGGHGQAAIPALTIALADPDLRVREEAAQTLQLIRD